METTTTIESENTFECDHCGKSFNTELTTTSDGEICNSCLESDYSLCDENNLYYLNSEMITAYKLDNNDRKVTLLIHKSCVGENFNLTDCGEVWHENNTSTAYNSRGREITIDPETREDDYFHCDSCDELHHNDRSNYIESDSETICEGCYQENYSYCDSCNESTHINNSCGCNESSRLINSYSFTPSLNFKGKNGKLNPFMGAEIEVENKSGSLSDLAETVTNILGDDIYLKEDGSLNNGFEIVTHPMTIDHHKTLSYKKAFDALSKAGARSHDTSTCGLHFHLDKRKMSDVHKVRFGSFFALQKNKLEVLARRSSESYAKFKNKGLPVKEYGFSETRYQAVNWENKNTVEVRIFKGTLKHETFMASMELCHSIYVFTSKQSCFKGGFNENNVWSNFLAFIKENKESYSFLLDYLESKKDALKQSIKLDEIENEKRKIDKKLKDEQKKYSKNLNQNSELNA